MAKGETWTAEEAQAKAEMAAPVYTDEGVNLSIQTQMAFGQAARDFLGGALQVADLPDVEQLAKEAGVLPQRKAVDVANHPLVFIQWREQTALVPDGSGEVTDGFLALCQNLLSNELFVMFLGGEVVCRTLRIISEAPGGARPFRARLEMVGRTWTLKPIAA